VKSCTASCSGSNGTWTSWQVAVPGATFRGKPAAISRGAGLIDIFVHGMDDHLWATWYNSSGPGSWYKGSDDTLGYDPTYPATTSPAASARTSDSLDVFVRGTDSKMWVNSWNSTSGVWSGFTALGGDLQSSPATVTRVRSTNRNDIVGFLQEETTANTWTLAPWWKEYQ
jgi:hypothetical protein